MNVSSENAVLNQLTIGQLIFLFILITCLLEPLTSKIPLVILLTVCHIVLVVLVLRIWYWIN